MIEVDIVIISYAKTEELQQVTERGIETLLASEDNIKFNVFVVESNKEVSYDMLPNTKTIYTDEEFNYNRYLNIGVSHGIAPYVCLCNSDLTYCKGWASEIILQMGLHPELLSASPFCPQTQTEQLKQIDLIYGYTIRQQLAGWAIFCQRKLFSIIGPLNTEVKFWFSDNIFSDQLIHHKIKHALVTNSIVNHHEHNLGVTGFSTLSQEKMNEYTMGQHQKYIEARTKLFNQ